MKFSHTPLAHNPVQRRRLRAAQTAITSELSYCSGIHRFRVASRTSATSAASSALDPDEH
jgi:hypothetical protein